MLGTAGIGFLIIIKVPEKGLKSLNREIKHSGRHYNGIFIPVMLNLNRQGNYALYGSLTLKAVSSLAAMVHTHPSNKINRCRDGKQLASPTLTST